MTKLTAVLLLYEPAGKYPRALERLIAVFERMGSVDTNLIVVDNGRPGDWEHQVSQSLLQTGGDNRAWEFSAFDKGLAVCERWQPGTELVALVTDAFAAYGQEYLELIDDQLIRCLNRLGACAGWMDSYGFETCRIGELTYDTWMRSSFLLIPRELLGLVRPFAVDLDSGELFGSGPEQPFAGGGLLSGNLEKLLLEWLTTGTEPGRLSEHWHSRLELSAESWPYFQDKVRAILREHLISARLQKAGVACYDFRRLRQLADEGRLEEFLDRGGDAQSRWLRWRRPPRNDGSPVSQAFNDVGAAAAAAATETAVVTGNQEPASAPSDLPAIHHYWSNTYLRPKLLQFGCDSPNEFFRAYTERLCRASPARRLRFLSLGGGDPNFEVELAGRLVAGGLSNFSLECAGLAPAILEHARQLAELAGVSGQMAFSTSGFDRLRPTAAWDAVIGNQSLHAVVELEDLFDAIRTGLSADGYFLAYDVIGRNGRALWPEALRLVERLWVELPERYRYNHRRQRPEIAFRNHELAPGGRSQDILPLLVERFRFELFLGFANVIGPFIGRSFGPNFDPAAETDRAFVDRVHAADDAALQAGKIKPTRMLAAMTVADTGIHLCDGELTAPSAIRPPDAG